MAIPKAYQTAEVKATNINCNSHFGPNCQAGNECSYAAAVQRGRMAAIL